MVVPNPDRRLQGLGTLEPSKRRNVMQEPRTRPATAADFHRLAALAHERGLQLFRDGLDIQQLVSGRAWLCHLRYPQDAYAPYAIAHQLLINSLPNYRDSSSVSIL